MGRASTDVHSEKSVNTTARTDRADGVRGDRIDPEPEDPTRFGAGYEHENGTPKVKARRPDVIATGQNSEARAGFGKTDSVNHILPGDVPVEKANDLIEQGGEV